MSLWVAESLAPKIAIPSRGRLSDLSSIDVSRKPFVVVTKKEMTIWSRRDLIVVGIPHRHWRTSPIQLTRRERARKTMELV
ncbi:hypothetical protein TIFTF001_014038 [Ficus carica]|uniref:Uncharacterized protein n=1 Tax=Ficus carica TaxID=3494 RepID=A0AA88A210_FICCA|nr:hypothetical protein TIFTF001_014038 [Ficus carica]